LCSLLRKCNKNDYCKLDGTSDGGLDLCKLNGTSAGLDVPGTASSSQLPAGACLETENCQIEGQFCNIEATTPFYLCSPSTGLDMPTNVGVCMLKPKEACQGCLQAVRPWVEDNANGVDNTSAILGANFNLFCKENKVSVDGVCDRVQQAIANSFKGNLARRAGALCLALGECQPAKLIDTDGSPVSLGVDAYAGPFSRCSKHGVKDEDDNLPNFPPTLDTSNRCR
jgi:hypothetical protein